MKTAIIQIVERPAHSNVKGGIKVRAILQPDGNYIANFGGRALLHIDSRDIVQQYETCSECGNNTSPIVLWGGSRPGDCPQLVCGDCAIAPLPEPTPEEIARDQMEEADRLMGY